MKTIKWAHYQDEITAFTTTKAVGNMAFQVGNDREEVLRARESIINDLNIEPSHLVFVHQSHSDRIEKVDESYFGKGQFDFESGPDCDALYTDKPGIALGIFHADCVPVFIYIPSKHIVGIIHAGYKGTLKEVTRKAIHHIIKEEKVDPSDIKAYIGPYLSEEFYNISDDEKSTIAAMGYPQSLKTDLDGNHVNVALMNEMQLEFEGVLKSNITTSIYDTGKDSFLFSAYKSHPVGRMASIIMLNEPEN